MMKMMTMIIISIIIRLKMMRTIIVIPIVDYDHIDDDYENVRYNDYGSGDTSSNNDYNHEHNDN